jgi:hypothetical protein
MGVWVWLSVRAAECTTIDARTTGGFNARRIQEAAARGFLGAVRCIYKTS